MLENYATLHKVAQEELTEKKSKFIATCAPVYSQEEAQNFINDLRKKYFNATHNVFAYRVFEKEIVERQSDDGEPNGTAGMPILEMLRKEEIQNAIVVVTRYYGGTLLGAGGLVRAYGHCAKKGVMASGLIKKSLYQAINIKVDYPLVGKVQYEALQNNYIIKDVVYKENVHFIILAKIGDTQNFIKLLTNLCNGTCDITLGEKIYGFWLNGTFYT